MPSFPAAFSSAQPRWSQWPLPWAPWTGTVLPLLAGVLLQSPTAAQFLVPPGFDAVRYCILQQNQASETGDCSSAVLFQGYQRSTTEDAIELVEPGLWWPQVAKRVQEVADEWAPVIPQESRRPGQPALDASSADMMTHLPGHVLSYASVVEEGQWHNASGTSQRLHPAGKRPDTLKEGRRRKHDPHLQRSVLVAHLNDSGSLLAREQDSPRHRNATTASAPRRNNQGGNASSKHKRSDSRVGSSFSISRTNRLALPSTQALPATQDDRQHNDATQTTPPRSVVMGSAASSKIDHRERRIGSSSSSKTHRLALLDSGDGQWQNATWPLAPSPQNVTGSHSTSHGDQVVGIQEHWRVAFLSGLAHAFTHARRLWLDGDGYTQTFVLIGVNLVLGVLLCIGLAAAFRGRSSRELPFLGGGPASGQQSPQSQQVGTVQPPKRLQPASVSPRLPDPVAFRERAEPFEPRIGGITSPHPEPRDLSLRGKMNAAATLAASPLLMSATPSRSIEDSAAKDDRPSIIDAILCVGLIVPEECECTLLVPHLAPRHISTQVTIEDVERTPALKAVFHLPTQEGRCLILADVDESNNMFAYCVRDFSNLALTIYGAEERHFGLIRMRGSRPSAGFEVITRKQAQLHIRCATNGEPRTFTDGHGRLLAVAEPVPDEHALRVVRIGPGVDAGLVVLSTLASDLLKAMLALEANQ